MNIAGEHKAICAALNSYEAQLHTIPDEHFTKTPPGGGWSYAEVYSHILKANTGSCIMLEKCTQVGCEPTSKGPTFLGRLLLFLGRFPPFKIKVPQAVADKMQVDKISKDDASQLLSKCRKRVDVMLPLAKDASPGSKTKHPRLGMLNAQQWFKFIRIHSVHHLKQLERIKKKYISL